MLDSCPFGLLYLEDPPQLPWLHLLPLGADWPGPAAEGADAGGAKGFEVRDRNQGVLFVSVLLLSVLLKMGPLILGNSRILYDLLYQSLRNTGSIVYMRSGFLSARVWELNGLY